MVTANGIKILVNELPRPSEDSNGSEGRECDDAVTAKDIKKRCKDDLAQGFLDGARPEVLATITTKAQNDLSAIEGSSKAARFADRCWGAWAASEDACSIQDSSAVRLY